jgi:AcrR family transcriptional regulator
MSEAIPEQQSSLAEKRDTAIRKDRAKYGAKRDSIVQAAGPLLLKNGLRGTTIGAIAKAAGVDRGTLYYYFPNKEDIFRSAIHAGIKEMVGQLELVAKSPEGPEVRLRESMRVVMRAFEKHYPYLYIFFQSGDTSALIDQGLNEQIVDSGRRYEALLHKVIRDGVKSGEFTSSLPATLTVRMIQGMLNWTHAWFMPGGKLNAVAVADGMADTVLDGLRRTGAHPD